MIDWFNGDQFLSAKQFNIEEKQNLMDIITNLLSDFNPKDIKGTINYAENMPFKDKEGNFVVYGSFQWIFEGDNFNNYISNLLDKLKYNFSNIENIKCTKIQTNINLEFKLVYNLEV